MYVSNLCKIKETYGTEYCGPPTKSRVQDNYPTRPFPREQLTLVLLFSSQAIRESTCRLFPSSKCVQGLCPSFQSWYCSGSLVGSCVWLQEAGKDFVPSLSLASPGAEMCKSKQWAWRTLRCCHGHSPACQGQVPASSARLHWGQSSVWLQPSTLPKTGAWPFSFM